MNDTLKKVLDKMHLNEILQERWLVRGILYYGSCQNESSI